MKYIVTLQFGKTFRGEQITASSDEAADRIGADMKREQKADHYWVEPRGNVIARILNGGEITNEVVPV